MIYFDSSALLKFVKPEKESQALRAWRLAQPVDSELVTSQLAVLEISRTLLPPAWITSACPTSWGRRCADCSWSTSPALC